MKKLFWIFVTIAAVLLIAGCGGSATKGKNLKAGFVYVGPVGDAGWTKSHDDGRLAMEKLDFVDESTYVENVPEGAEATRVITELAESGCDMIFTTSRAAAVARGVPPKVVAWLPKSNPFAASFVAIMAPMGIPLARALARVMISGVIP